VKRGEIRLVAAPGDYGKPRPAVVIQTDLLNEGHASVVVCLMTSDVVEAPLLRVDVAPSAGSGLRRPSQVMVDKLVTLRRERVGDRIGALDEETLLRLDRALALVLGLAK
jgi:mRNA interferase MazF